MLNNCIAYGFLCVCFLLGGFGWCVNNIVLVDFAYVACLLAVVNLHFVLCCVFGILRLGLVIVSLFVVVIA